MAPAAGFEHLLAPGRIGPLELANRIVLLARLRAWSPIASGLLSVWC